MKVENCNNLNNSAIEKISMFRFCSFSLAFIGYVQYYDCILQAKQHKQFHCISINEKTEAANQIVAAPEKNQKSGRSSAPGALR